MLPPHTLQGTDAGASNVLSMAQANENAQVLLVPTSNNWGHNVCSSPSSLFAHHESHQELH